MHSERMSMPKWAKVAATRLSDAQLASIQERSDSRPQERVPRSGGIDCRPIDSASELIEDGSETVGGTVSRKEKWGFTCEKCHWVPTKGAPEEWIPTLRWIPNTYSIINSMVQVKRTMATHLPHRCKRCKSRMKRWTCAARNYDKLEILRVLEERHCLRFVTFTKEEWNVNVNAYDRLNNLWVDAEEIKKTAVRQFRNWRNRNDYFRSREAKGQCYYECTMKPVWKGWGWDEVQLHFHIHTVVCSKRIENKDIQIDLDTLEPIPMSTTIQREWGGIVDVRKCRTWQHKDGEIKTSKRFVMNYLVDYINKAGHWQSSKFGDWSN